MPNWCNNTVKIMGDHYPVGKVKEFLKEGDRLFSLNNILPIPKERVEVDNEVNKIVLNGEGSGPDTMERLKELQGKGSYDWCVDNWGTKWDIEECHLNEDNGEGHLEYHFDSAWAPPSNALLELSKKFPSLNIQLYYEEFGMCYRGKAGFTEGKVYLDEYEEDVDFEDCEEWY